MRERRLARRLLVLAVQLAVVVAVVVLVDPLFGVLLGLLLALKPVWARWRDHERRYATVDWQSRATTRRWPDPRLPRTRFGPDI